MQLIIVESPTKAKTISRFVDNKDYVVESSFGHVRDLPVSKMGIDIEHDFTPEYVVPKDKSKVVTSLKKHLAKADGIILATDEDREGEAIAWHLLNSLGVDKSTDVKRIVFHEITKDAIQNALKHPRSLNTQLVDAQQARRILDRLVGYELSPFLWKKVAKGLSAGRVQSAAVRLIAEKEDEIKAFNKQEYWSIRALLDTKENHSEANLQVKLSEEDNNGDDEAEEKINFEVSSQSQLIAALHSHKGKPFEKFDIADREKAEQISSELKSADFTIKSIEKKQQRRSPQPPFTTSTLQQTANRRLGFSAKQTMYLAQQLYEGMDLGSRGTHGLITYMRTDSVSLAQKFLDESRAHVSDKYGKEYLPAEAVNYRTKSKGAQEAHEAIRPTMADLTPEEAKQYLDDKQLRLYTLIWQRAVASQMKPAIFDATTVEIEAGDYLLKANGQIITFPGFMKVYPTDSKETILPELEEKQTLYKTEILASQHFTKPPARYSDATLVKKLEELGIGRPSTYAPIISTIQDRHYVEKDGRHLKPTEMGIIVNNLLVKHFPNIVDYNFTASMEDQLDEVATGERQWVPVIREFYNPFKDLLEVKKDEVSKKDLEEETDEKCEKCGSAMLIKVGRYGKFMACSAYPDCKNTKPINGDGDTDAPEPKSIGKDPKSGLEIFQLTGRFGPYIQLGEKDENNPKPKRASLKYASDPKNVRLEEALKLLSLPRTLGQHPEKKEPVVANIGRFGPYVGCDGEYRSVKDPDNVFEIPLERAVELLNQPKSSNGRQALKDLGKHKNKKVTVQTGRYGPYIKYGTKNIALPKDLKDEAKAKELTLEEAIKIIDDK